MRGCLVISSSRNDDSNLKDFYQTVFEDSMVFHGNSFTDKFSISTNTSINTEAGSFAVSDDEIYEMPVPTRGSIILNTFEGVIPQVNQDIINDFTEIDDERYKDKAYCASKLLTHLNSNKHKDCFQEKEIERNYNDLIKARIVDRIDGSWAFSMAYIAMSGKGRIVIARKLRDVYFHFVSTNTFNAIVWTTDLHLFHSLDKRFFVYSMTPLAHKDSLVLHPLFLIDKWKRWNSKKTKTNSFSAISILEQYLTRSAR